MGLPSNITAEESCEEDEQDVDDQFDDESALTLSAFFSRLTNISGSTIVEDEHRNYCSEFAVEETSLEVPETNADENSLGRGKRVKRLNSKYAGAFWKVH